MVAQIRNSDMVEILAADFQRRYEPQFALANSVGLFCNLQNVRGYWSMGAGYTNAGGTYATDIPGAYDLGLEANPMFSRFHLAPYMDFVAANSQYLTYADDPNFDIIGNEAYVANPGLTLGGWFWFDAPSMGALVGLIAKSANNDRAYQLQKRATDLCRFGVSTDGVNLVNVTHTTTNVVSAWYWVAARFIPGTELAIWVNDTKVTNVVGIPATIFNSTQPFNIGLLDAGYLDGRASQCFVCGAALSNSEVGMLYEGTRAMFGA